MSFFSDPDPEADSSLSFRLMQCSESWTPTPPPSQSSEPWEGISDSYKPISSRSLRIYRAHYQKTSEQWDWVKGKRCRCQLLRRYRNEKWPGRGMPSLIWKQVYDMCATHAKPNDKTDDLLRTSGVGHVTLENAFRFE